MKRALVLLFAAAWPLFAAAQARQPSSLIVAPGHSSVIAWPGVTAAYSMEPDTVEATAVVGGVRITGRMPGQASVILVTVAGTRTLSVTVPAPPQRFGGKNLGAGQTVEFGTYNFQYNNGPNQISNTEDVTQIAGERRIHVHIMNTNIFPSGDVAPVGFPIFSYEISHPGRTVTLMDDLVNNSPLTLQTTFVRGVHLQTGPWEFHAGITALTTFQDFILPSNRWEIAGISRHFTLNHNASLEGNFYYFATDTSVNSGATPGPIATLYYQYHKLNGLDAKAEFGVGNGYAFSGELMRETKKQQLHAQFQYESPKIASPGFSGLHGRMANLNWTNQLLRRFLLSASVSDTNVNLPIEQQQVDTTSLIQTYKLTPHVGLTGGFVASRFLSILPAASTIRSSGFQMGPQLQWRHVGGSFQYQKQNNSGNNPDSISYTYNAQTSFGSLGISGYYSTQTETPVLAPVQGSTQPGLAQELNYESEAALNPAQMSHFLQQTSSLSARGFIQPVTFGLATRRDQYGLNVEWGDKKTGQLNFNGLLNSSEGGNVPSLRLITGSLTWTRKFGQANTLNADFSLSRSATSGQTTFQPLEQVSWQHNLNSVPRWLVPGRRGTISGHVFLDNNYTQIYAKTDTGLQGVLVYLDGRRSTHTDRDGYYVFHGVPYGVHSVEADYHDSKPFYFTSSSPKSIPTGATADFGISFAKGRIFGSFTNDAGTGLEVRLTLQGAGINRDITTNGGGTVEVDGLPYGTYTVTPDPSSLPPGYSLSDLADQTIVLTAKQAAHFAFQVHAQRSISGRVEIFDPTTGRRQPLVGTTVSLSPGQLVAHTDGAGRYLFRQLPPGSYTVTVVQDGKLWSRPIDLDPTPDVATDVNITITKSSTPASEPALPIEPPPLNQPRRERQRPRPRLQSRRRDTAPRAAEPGSAGNEQP
jgi:hypothetical protein